MLALCLSAILLAAPIPKQTREGTIAVLLQGSKETQVLLLNPDGEEQKRIKFKDYQGDPFRMAISPSGNRILFMCNVREKFQKIGQSEYACVNWYEMTLKQGEEPKLLFKDKLGVNMVFGQDSETVYGSELNQEELKKNPTSQSPYKSWKLNLKTGVTEPIPLPGNNMIENISLDGKTVLTTHKHQSKNYVAISQTSDWKPTIVNAKPSTPISISPNGNNVIYSENTEIPNNIYLHKQSINKRQILPRSSLEGSLTRIHQTFSPDGKRISYVEMFKEVFINGEVHARYEVCVCDLDGSNRKIIFEMSTSSDQIIQDVIWH